MKFTLTIIFTSLILFSCCDTENYAQESFFWTQTKCADPWGTNMGNTNDETISAVIKFLNSNGIDVEDVQIEFDINLVEACRACSCTTGNKIIVAVSSNYIFDMKNLNFKIYN